MFLLIFLLLLGAVFGYPTWRLLSILSVPPGTAWAVAGAVLLVALLPLAYLLGLRRATVPAPVRRGVAWVAYAGLGSAVTLFDIVVVRDLLWLAAGFVDPGLLEGRQRASAVVCLLLAALVIPLAVRAAHRPRLRRVTVPVRGLAPQLQGLRIVQISDLHAGPTIRRPFFERVAAVVETEAPDLIAFTGDLADGSPAELASHVQPLSRLRAPLGCWAVTGNHDYYGDADGWLAVFRRLGMRLVLNGHAVVEHDGATLVVGGLPDPAGAEALPGRPEHTAAPESVFRGAPAGLRLLLVHQPRAAVAAAAAAADLTLSGHTHGGQLIPWGVLVRLQQPLLSGLHRAAWGGWIYVSRGTGYWGPPMRLGVGAEITCLTLTAADA